MALIATAVTGIGLVAMSVPAEAATRLEAENSSFGGSCGDNSPGQYTYTTGAGETLLFNGGDYCTMTFNASGQTAVEQIRWFGGGQGGDICGDFIVKQGGVEKARSTATTRCSVNNGWRLTTFPVHTLSAGSFEVVWDADQWWHDAHVDWIDVASSATRREAESSSYSASCGDSSPGQYTYTTGAGETVLFNGGDYCTMTFSNTSTAPVQRIRWFGGGQAGDICGDFIVKQGGVEKARSTPTTRCSVGNGWQLTTFPAHTLSSGSFDVVWDADQWWHDAHVDYIETGSGSTSPPPCGNPTVGLTPASQSGTAPYSAAFTLTAAAGAGCTIANHDLTFGDGSNQAANGAPPATATHTYTSPGTYTAKLTVTQSDGKTSNATATVTANGPAAGNDSFAAATAVQFFPFTDTKTTTSYTTEAGESTNPCGTVGKTAWYRLAPDATFDVTADTVGGTNFDTVLAVYSGTSIGSLTQVTCNDQIDGGNQSRVSFRAHAGTTYYMQVGGYYGASGTLQFDVNGQLAASAPSAPRTVSVTAPAAGQLRASWTAPATGTPVTAYRIYVGPTKVGEVNGLTTTFTESNVNPGLRTYTVKAVNNGGEGPGASATGRAYASYRVELRAFIPHWRVVDPQYTNNPDDGESGYGYANMHYFGGGSCNTYASNLSTVWSWFAGDNHKEFDDGSGTFRVRGILEFRWDGEALTNATIPNEPHYNPTHRWRRYQDGLLRQECALPEKTATEDTNAYAMSSTSFRIDYHSENPHTPATFTPAIDAWIEGSFTGNTLNLRYASDDFPTNAFRVTRNGAVQLTSHIRDVSCLSDSKVRSAGSSWRIFVALNTMMPEGSTTVQQHDVGRLEKTNSGTC